MSARRIARELTVILLPQLPKDKAKLDTLEIEALASKAVAMLCDYARENLAEVDALTSQALDELDHIEIEHPENRRSIAKVIPVSLTSGQMKEQFNILKRTINAVAEALDVPSLALQTTLEKANIKAFLSCLVNAYAEHKEEIDNFIRRADAKWQIERMVSIDRNILRLACAEAFYMPEIPIPVAINEAVELCHRFADEKAAKFINGILADLSQEAEYYRQHGQFPDPDAINNRTDKNLSAKDKDVVRSTRKKK